MLGMRIVIGERASRNGNEAAIEKLILDTGCWIEDGERTQHGKSGMSSLHGCM